MSLFVLGINHRTAPVALREQVAFDGPALPEALRELMSLDGVDEAVVVSTCNRTELILVVDGEGSTRAEEWLISNRQVDPETCNCIYRLSGHDAIAQVFLVASGLDSMIVGEPQILGQVKQAYREAQSAGAVGTLLNRLFQRAFSVAKQVRTDTEIGASAVSVAFAAVRLCQNVFSSLDKRTALLVGAGDTVELATRHLHAKGLGRMIIANRSVGRARSLAAEFDAYAIGLDEIEAHLADADIVFTSTASPVPIVTREMVSSALKKRKRQPMFIVDVAVPRDVAPDVGELSDVFLYTVDDLQSVIRENLKSRHEAASQAREIVLAETARFELVLKTLDAAPLIRQLRTEASALRQEALTAAKRRLAAGDDPEQVIEALAGALTKKLMHVPSTRLRRAGEEGDKLLMQVARELFGIEED
ncbi:MAG: glutamyl-tRNA reductase [Gammaproteobacteria bacterium]|nr:glutamyl-tRNA reductase [Gammaproteobacteria bacterium]